ncbi:MAG TPA: HDIG domain-containing protein, partial [Candidatus Polarisedimenticolia bacterium]|nr:HDIG domain-containing protein [Candidatus Polarisedimenticolia bacterium]
MGTPRNLGSGPAGLRNLGARLQGWFERLLGRDLLWAVVFVILATPLVSRQEWGLPAPHYDVGEVTPWTLKAPYDIELVDEQAWQDRRAAEREAVPPVYDYVADLAFEQRQRISEAFERGRAALRAMGLPAGRGRPAPDAETLARVKASVGTPMPSAALAVLIARGFPQEIEQAMIRALGSVMHARVVGSVERLPESGPIVVREVRAGAPLEAEHVRPDQVRDLDDARRLASEQLDQDLGGLPASDRRALGELLDRHVIPNLSYNASETERRRMQAMASVPQVFMRIPKGRVIVREGEVFTQEAVDLLARIHDRRSMRIDWRELLGDVVILGLLVWFLHRYVRAHQKVFRRVQNLYALVLLVTFSVTLGSRVGIFIADAVADRLLSAPFNNGANYYWALPVAAGAMLVTLLANARVATVLSAVIAVLFGMVRDWSAAAILFAMLSSFASIYAVSKYERRTAILKAGGVTGLVNAAVVLAIDCVDNGFSPASEGLFRMATAAAGGLLAAPVVSACLPPLEWLFNVLTDIRLLELSNLDNPLLRRLSLEAPGTYNHSVIVGTLAEQAAEVIGAHALLCRVGAYYHDIGKMSKPDYFVENMRSGQNRHDRLSPRMSSLIIASHVKEGMRLAEEHNLPRQIRDIIPQHHGTRLITFFFRKAKRNEDPDARDLHESDYRYPGPRPQTREAAIFMMADSVEAAARSVEEPTP